VGAVFGFVFGVWMVGTLLSWPYFWATRAKHVESPRDRRLLGLGLAAAWPYHVFVHFQRRGDKTGT
jgi:hypothetical protein